jgi:hypothetical protein
MCLVFCLATGVGRRRTAARVLFLQISRSLNLYVLDAALGSFAGFLEIHPSQPHVALVDSIVLK